MHWREDKDGDIRYREKFFWLPEIVNGVTYWLETRWVKERYHSCVLCAGWDVIQIDPPGVDDLGRRRTFYRGDMPV